jgi:hypothetical protein
MTSTTSEIRVTACRGTVHPTGADLGLVFETDGGTVVVTLDHVTAYAVELALRTRLRCPNPVGVDPTLP